MSPAFDSAQVLLEELDQLAYPWPIPVQKAGPRGVYEAAKKLLEQEGHGDGYTEAELRLAIATTLRDLVADLPKVRAIRLDDPEAEQLHVHACAERLLLERGLIEYSPADYIDAWNHVPNGRR